MGLAIIRRRYFFMRHQAEFGAEEIFLCNYGTDCGKIRKSGILDFAGKRSGRTTVEN